MYMNASTHIANLKAPRANGIGALPSQQMASQPGAVNRRPSQTFAKYRSASTGVCDERPISARVKWPEPPQRSTARPPPARTRAGDRANDRIGDDEGRIGKSIQKVAAFEVWTERVNEVAIRGGLRARGRLEHLGLRIVLEAEHDPAREIGTPGLHLIARGRRGRQQMQNRYSGHDREDAAMAAEDPVLDFVAVDLIEERRDEREPAAAVWAA